jgi:tripartite-type tricarboxylate transporter receptor subunit TctC
VLFTRWLTLAIFSLAIGCNLAVAQSFPTRPIKLIVPYPPSSNPDILARLVGELVAERLKQPVIVDNKAGAGGTIGTDAAAKATPDGYTLLVVDSGPLAIAPWIYPKIPYSSAKDLVGVASLATVPMVMIVPRNSSVNTPADFAALAKSRPGALYYGSVGVGSIHHLATEVYSAAAGMQLTHVPYKGNAELAAAVVNGDVQMAFSGIPSVAGFIKEGRMRAVGLTSAKRSSALPEVRTFQEQGFRDYDVTTTMGVVAPTGVPADRLKLLEQAFLAALKDPKLSERLIGLGMILRPSSGEAYSATIAFEYVRFGKIVKTAGIQPQ